MINWKKVGDGLPNKCGEYRVLAIWPKESEIRETDEEPQPKPGFGYFDGEKFLTSWWREKIIAWSEIDQKTIEFLNKSIHARISF